MLNIIPKPLKYKENIGSLRLTFDSKLFISKELKEIKPVLTEAFALFSKTKAARKAESADFAIVYDETLGQEEYKIVITENGGCIKAGAYAGALYAIKTLEQMSFFGKDNAETLIFSCAEIEDKPRYKHRGLMLDESRHFFGKEEVKRILSIMAFYKLNTFHWHLTDDQGWRIEIKKYPLLTEIGSKRKDTQIGGWRSLKYDGNPHSGYYTQEDIKEIVDYASKLSITIIPEIDMPAHFAAAIAAYSYLACRDIKSEVHWFFGGHVPTTKGWFDYNRPSCAGRETTYQFIYDVLDEITELFPAPYFHIGGDEAPKNEWKKCPDCQKMMKDNGLKNEEELQGFFNNRISKYLEKKGKRLIVWNEALKAENLDRSVIGEYWTAKKDNNVMKHIENGGDVVICKHQAFYFDMTYYQYPLSNTYNFEATEKMIPEKYGDRVLGLEGELWTEWVATEEKIDLQLFPRMLALSECCWVTDKKKDFEEFLSRKDSHEKMLDALGVNYAVDEVSMPKNIIKRKLEERIWFYSNTDREVAKNRALKNK